MASAGYNSKLEWTGDAVSFSTEAMSDTGNGTLWRIDDSSKEIFDPSASFTIEVDTGGGFSTVSPSTYQIKYLQGAVEFDTDQTGNSVQISGDYLPTYDTTWTTAVTYNRTYEEVDSWTLTDVSERRLSGLADMEATLTHIDTSDDPIDGSGGSEDTVFDLFEETDRPLVVTFIPEYDSETSTVNGYIHRSFCKLMNHGSSNSPDGRVETELTLMGDKQDAVDSEQDAVLFDAFKR